MIASLTRAHARWLYDHQHDAYPQSYHMDEDWFINAINDNLSVGYFDGDALIAWLLVSKENNDGVYIEDLAVLPDHQHQGIGKQLWLHALPYLPDKIRLDARTTSHDLFLRHHPGYAIVSDNGAHDSELDEYFWDMRFKRIMLNIPYYSAWWKQWVENKENDDDNNGIPDWPALLLARLLPCRRLSK